MKIWQKDIDLNRLREMPALKIMAGVGFEYVALEPDYLAGRIKVDENSHQPMGILHGGAICLLAEQVGSVAAYLCTPHDNDMALGMNLNAHYFRPTRSGWATATARPNHLGKSTQVWDIGVTNDDDAQIARITFAVAIRRFDSAQKLP